MTNGFKKKRDVEKRMATKKKVIYRNSKTGEITTREYAERHPATTEREHVTVKKPKKK